MRPAIAPKLVIRRSDGSIYEMEWDKDAISIGRDGANDIIIAHSLASRRHARLDHDENGFSIYDLESTNGTYVNGERIQDGCLLHHQDQIIIADTVITFQDPEATVKGALPPEVLRAVREQEQAREREELVVDSYAKAVYIKGELLQPPLTVKEFQLLELLYQRTGQIVSKNDIAEVVWDYEVFDYNAIDALIYRLRQRIEPEPTNPRYLITQRGFGYRLITSPKE